MFRIDMIDDDTFKEIVLAVLNDDSLDEEEKLIEMMANPDIDLDPNEIEQLIYTAYRKGYVNLLGQKYRVA